MASAQVVETSVTNNSPSQDSYHPDDLFQSKYLRILERKVRILAKNLTKILKKIFEDPVEFFTRAHNNKLKCLQKTATKTITKALLSTFP